MYECVFLWKGLRAEYSEKIKVVGFDACLTRPQCHQDNRRTAYARVDGGRLPMMPCRPLFYRWTGSSIWAGRVREETPVHNISVVVHNGSRTAEWPTEKLMFSLYCVIELSASYVWISHPHLPLMRMWTHAYLFVYCVGETRARCIVNPFWGFYGIVIYSFEWRAHNAHNIGTGKCAVTLAKGGQTNMTYNIDITLHLANYIGLCLLQGVCCFCDFCWWLCTQLNTDSRCGDDATQPWTVNA